MQPIVCWNILQAWKVKETFDAQGYHVRINIAYPFRDYINGRRPKDKRAFICCMETEPPAPWPHEIKSDNPVLSFVERMLKFRDRALERPNHEGENNGQT